MADARVVNFVRGLSYGIVCAIVCLAVLIQYWHMMDRQTEGQTRDDS